MSDRIYRQSEKILRDFNLDIEESFTIGHIALFDELNAPRFFLMDTESTNRQKVRHARKSGYMDIIIALIVTLIMAAMVQNISELHRHAKRIYSLNYKFISGKEKEGKPRKYDLKKIEKEVKKVVEKKVELAIIRSDPRELKRPFTHWQNITKRLSRTEVTRIMNQARLDALIATGATHKRWDSILDKVTRDSHRRLHGEVQPIDKPFSNKLMFPGDPDGALEETMNCRCILQKADALPSENAGSQSANNPLQNEPDDGILAKTSEGNPSVQSIGEIDLEKFRSISGDISTNEVVITKERIDHIEKRHPGDYEKYSKYIPEMLKKPNYILKDDNPNTAILLKAFADERFQLVLRLQTVKDIAGRKNSIITFMRVGEKRYEQYIKNKEILYKSD